MKKTFVRKEDGKLENERPKNLKKQDSLTGH